jgi:hypothetical protein
MPEGEVGSRVLAGSCECGAVRYRVADEFLYASNCHCSRCRAATGSAFKPFVGIEREKLEITAGRDALFVYGEEDLNDTRCATCGSLLFPSCATAPTCKSRWGRSSMLRACGRRSTSSSGRRRRGSRSPTRCRSSKITRPDERSREVIEARGSPRTWRTWTGACRGARARCRGRSPRRGACRRQARAAR